MKRDLLKEWTEKNRKLKAKVDYSLEYYGLRDKQKLAKEMGISRASLYNKLKDPNRFTLGELRKLSVILHWTDEETGNII